MNLNNLKQEADKIRLTSAEKSAMRAAVFPMLQSEPRPQSVGVGSPYFFFFAPRYLVASFVVLVVLVSSGTVSAAQGALPGDLLYPVKVSINEKVEVALAPTPAAKAEVQARLADRRVEEAQTLAAQGRLDKKTAETLTVDFDEHAAQAVALAGPDEQEVEDASKNEKPATAAEPARQAAPAQATMMLQAATTSESEKQEFKKPEGRRGSLRESLRVKGEILQELKVKASNIELQLED